MLFFVGQQALFDGFYCTGMDIQHRLDAVAALTLGTRPQIMAAMMVTGGTPTRLER